MWPNPQFPANLFTFTEEILKGKLHFCAVSEFLIKSYREGKNTKIILSMLQCFQHSSLSAVGVVNHGTIIRTGIS